MARKGSGLRSAIKVVKFIDKAGKQLARESERRRKQEERERARQEREMEKQLRQEERECQKQLKQEEREEKFMEKYLVAAKKERFKIELESAKDDFECRCLARQELRKEFVNSEAR